MATQALPYAYITFIAARQQISNRLYDSTQQFWPPAEVGLYLIEALQTWNALTGYWRGDYNFPTVQGQNWYNLTTVANTLRPLTVTDASVYQFILQQLLEPATGPVSVQYTTDDIYEAIARRRDELLSITGCTQTRTLLGVAVGRTTLSDQVIDVRRIAYLPLLTNLTGAGYGLGPYGLGPYGISISPGNGQPLSNVLWADDTWGNQSFQPLYTITPAGTPGRPNTYMLSTQPPLSFDVDVPPAYGGSYEVISVNAGPALNPAVPVPGSLSVPDDWVHVVKWGALADLFGRESNAEDPLRKQYCETRYRMGAAILAKSPALLAMRNGTVQLQIDSVREADLYRTTWQSESQGNPNLAIYAGLNLLALAPAPDAGPLGVPYSLTATVVENAPLPVVDTDLVQVARDDLDAVIDYAVHIAMLKTGGKEFSDSAQLLQRFMKQAALYNTKLNELGEFTEILYGLGKREQAMNPRLQDETVIEATSG